MSRLMIVAILLLAATSAAEANEGFCPCPADTNGCGSVDVNDLLNVIIDWGSSGENNNGDVNDDGIVDVLDLLLLILSWGPCPSTCCGASSAGDCLSANGTPYCDDADCCEAVCAKTPHCCGDEWDQACVDLAVELCPPDRGG